MHQPPNSKPLSYPLRGGSFGGDLLKANPPKTPPLNPHVRPYGWPIPNPQIPPWYPLVATQPIT